MHKSLLGGSLVVCYLIYRWHTLMDPARSMLKFRLPYGAGTTSTEEGGGGGGVRSSTIYYHTNRRVPERRCVSASLGKTDNHRDQTGPRSCHVVWRQ